MCSISILKKKAYRLYKGYTRVLGQRTDSIYSRMAVSIHIGTTELFVYSLQSVVVAACLLLRSYESGVRFLWVSEVRIAETLESWPM